MRGYFEAGAELGILAWVFARPLLFEPVIAGLSKYVDSIQQIYLIARPEVLGDRLRSRGSDDRLEYALSRLDLIDKLPFLKIDTSELQPDQVVTEIMASLD